MLVSPKGSATYTRRNNNAFPCFTTPNHRKVNSSRQQSNFGQDNWFNLINMFLSTTLQQFIAFLILIIMSNIVPSTGVTDWKGIDSVHFEALHTNKESTLSREFQNLDIAINDVGIFMVDATDQNELIKDPIALMKS